MNLWQWWKIRATSWRLNHARRKRRRALVRQYHNVPNAKRIIRSLDMPRGMQTDVLKRIKESLWESEGHDAKSKHTRNGI